MDLVPSTIQKYTFEDGSSARFKAIGKFDGTRIPTVYIGGSFQDIDNMERLLKTFTKLEDFIIFEAPGYGQTELMSRYAPTREVAFNIGTLLVALGVPKINLLAVSYGGLFAGPLSEHPELIVARAVLVGFGPLPQKTIASLQLCLKHIEDGAYEACNKEFIGALLNYDRADDITRFWCLDRLVSRSFSALSHSDYQKFSENTHRIIAAHDEGAVSAPSCPTLMVSGEYDEFTPVAKMRQAAASYPNVQVSSIPNADHFCHFQEQVLLAYKAHYFLEYGVDLDVTDRDAIEQLDAISSAEMTA